MATTDEQCVQLLQWAFPQLQLRWPGFRKVRRQVRKRLNRRLRELGQRDTSDYRAYLESHPEEWPIFDRLCQISLSRFYRDRSVFDQLRDEILPALAQAVTTCGEKEVSCWSAGCASGEEVYTLAILWKACVSPQFPGISLRQVATDANEQLLGRARRACYAAGSLKDVPPGWLGKAFVCHGQEYVVRAESRTGIEFRQQDIRKELPGGPFHLVLCRNLVFTYFAEELQQTILGQIRQHMLPDSFLVIGKQEQLPADTKRLLLCGRNTGIYRSIEAGLDVKNVLAS